MDQRVTVEKGWRLPAVDIDLVLAIAANFVALACIYLPIVSETPARSLAGLGFALTVPGYSLIAALFPGKKDLEALERAGLAVGLSMVVTALVGLGLNMTPWGIRLGPIVASLTLITIISCVVAHFRRRRSAPEDRLSFDLKGSYSAFVAGLFAGDRTQLDRALSVAVVVCAVAAIATLFFVIAAPKTGEQFTQFYILGPDGKAYDYPEMIKFGDSSPVIVGIMNKELRDVTYDLVVSMEDGAGASQLYTDRITLANDEALEKQINLTPDRKGSDMKVKFMLYTDGEMTEPYREVHLWVNVT